MNLGYPKISISRSASTTQPKFESHMNALVVEYGLVHILDLLSQKARANEAMLSTSYNYHIREIRSGGTFNYSQFDLYEIIKNYSIFDIFYNNDSKLIALEKFVNKDVQAFGYTVMKNGTIIKTQKGAFRVNCFDCLDRTNICQHFICRKVIDVYIRTLSNLQENHSIVNLINAKYSKMWTENGHVISSIFTGTETLKSHITRSEKSNFFSFIGDLQKSATRLYKNSLREFESFSIINTILGYSCPDLVKIRKFVLIKDTPIKKKTELEVNVLTWNINCYKTVKKQDLTSLIPCHKETLVNIPKAFILCLQEIVELSPAQVPIFYI